MQVGYIRAKAGDEDALPVQRQALRDAGCGKVIEELVSAGRCGQPGLRRLVDELISGDVVVVLQLHCLGQSLPDVVRMMGRIGTAGAGFRGLAKAIDATAPAGQATAEVIGSLAAFGRSVARDRIGKGLAAARGEGAWAAGARS